jgi:hypothetical protein
MTHERLSSEVQRLFSRVNETGRQFHVNGITVIKSARTVESAGTGASFFISPEAGGIAAGRVGRREGTSR